MSVITKATTTQYLNALGYARRASYTAPEGDQRVQQIDSSLSNTDEYVTAIARAFWMQNARLTFPKQALHTGALMQYHEEVCHIRLVWESGLPLCIRPAASGGYIVLNGELMGLWSTVRGRGNWLLDHAINDGATRLSCFDIPHLVKLYRNRGFVDYRREANTNVPDKPDVIWMERNAT
uniref:Acetyltransferase n=3 Tax=unclassified bacterial viruses TaxID=12333 RepID=A0AAU6W0S8_9VIRU